MKRVPGAAPPEPVEEESSPEVPDHAHTVLVPLANPESARDLLQLARAVVRADGGKVVALSVAIGDADAEQSVARMDALEKLVHEFDPKYELQRRSASTIARGILDAARESGADMMVLGLNHVSGGRVELGQVIESVVSAATIDVLLYRPGRAVTDLEHLDKVVVGVDDSTISRAAARVGIILGHGFGRPIEVVTVHDGGRPRSEAWATLDRALRNVPGREDCRLRVVQATTAAAGLTSSTDRDDLVLVGFEDRSGFREWIEGDVVRRVLDRAAGPTIAVSRRQPETKPSVRTVQKVVDWLRPQLTDVERETIVWRSQALSTASLDYMTLIVVAAALASFGLLLNSPAVIIGAMLVAPLMGPLVGFGIALRVARLTVVRQAFLTTTIGAGSAFGVSVLIGAVFRIGEPTTEMLARGSPSLLDAGVAIASGVVGAYATARKDIPSALAGVAIAAALVPPICVSGLALGIGEVELAAGAALLFLVNITCIASIGAGVFAWLGLAPAGEADPRQRHISVLGALFLPVLIGVLVAVSAARFSVNDTQVAQALEDVDPGLELASVDVVDTRTPYLRVTVRGSEAPTAEDVDVLRQLLRRELDRDGLDVEVLFLEVVSAG